EHRTAEHRPENRASGSIRTPDSDPEARFSGCSWVRARAAGGVPRRAALPPPGPRRNPRAAGDRGTYARGVNPHTTPSLWMRTAPEIVVPDDPPPATAGIVIAGAGLTGLALARMLAHAGADVVVLEARTVGAVATGN